MEVIVVEAGSEFTSDTLVGVFSSFDKAVVATEAYAMWHGRPDDGFWFTPQFVDTNNTGTCARYSSFRLKAGEVPPWYSYKEQGK
jgi:hypothetical protein